MDPVRPSEYADGKAGALDNLDRQRFTSHIPVPSQAKRRNSASANLSDMMNRSIARNSLTGTKKRARTTVGSEGASSGFRLSQRYSSLPSGTTDTQSFAVLANGSDVLGISGQATSTNRDPRPLRDKNFQNAIQQEIFDYLATNSFDLETNNPISLKFLKQPTQKGFVVIFRWLYLRLDPGYIFTKSIEHEVYQLLRTLQYPYLETINKSQISAVGGSSWPKFLGMLHWLVRINMKLDRSLTKLDRDIISQNTQELTILNHPLNTLDEQDQKQEKYELMVEKLFIEYVTDSYKSFLHLEDDYTPYMKELQEGFGKFTRIIETDIKNMGIQNQKIYLDCQELAKRNKKIGIAASKCKALKGDLTKFQNYVNTMEHKSHEWPKKLDKMRAESKSKAEQIKDLEKQVRESEEFLTEKGISIGLIDEKTKQKETITNELEKSSEESDRLTSILKSEKHDTEAILKNLMITVQQYNSSITNLVKSMNQRGDTIDLTPLKIEISEKALEEMDAVLYENLFPPAYTIKGNVKDELLKLYHHIKEKMQEAHKETSLLENELVGLKEQLNEKTALISQLELELSETNSKYELNKQETESDLLLQKIEIERLKKKIEESRRECEEKVSEAQKLVESAKLQHEELILNLNKKRIAMHKQVIDIIEYVSNFKINIQGALEKAESDISQQLASVEL